jgi:hypothetical protein
MNGFAAQSKTAENEKMFFLQSNASTAVIWVDWGIQHPDHWACEMSVSHLLITERAAYASKKAQPRWKLGWVTGNL